MNQRPATAIDAVEAMVRRAFPQTQDFCVIGLCGAQGSGKSTLAAALKQRFDSAHVPTALLSIDDLYRTRAEREALARTVHPLLRTRGVPGTHDVALGLDSLSRLKRGEGALLPRFDKAADDRLPESRWERAAPGTRLLILEGWCVGARPQPEGALLQPVNALEQEEDQQGIWRRFVNAALAAEYQALFGAIDRLVLLAAPGFDHVLHWRRQQEEELRSRAGTAGPGIMSDDQLVRFVQHYERITRHILAEMPARADMVIALDEERRVKEICQRP